MMKTLRDLVELYIYVLGSLALSVVLLVVFLTAVLGACIEYGNPSDLIASCRKLVQHLLQDRENG